MPMMPCEAVIGIIILSAHVATCEQESEHLHLVKMIESTFDLENMDRSVLYACYSDLWSVCM